MRREIREDRAVLQLTNPSGLSPLEHAIELMANKRGSSVEMVNLLLDEGADPNFRSDPNGPTALHYAVGANELSADVQQRIVTLLVKHGANPSFTDYYDQTPAQMPGSRPEIRGLLANADALRRSFMARGGVAVAHDRPTTPPPVVAQTVKADSPLQRVVGGAVQAVVAAGTGIVSGLGAMQPAPEPPAAAVPVAAVPDAELRGLFDQQNGALAMGNDVHVMECTLQEAFRKCLNLEAAVGFTYAPTAALPGGRYRCYLKSARRKNRDPLWQTFLQKPQAPSAVVAPVVQSAATTAPAAQLPAVPPARSTAASGGAGDADAAAETSDYNLRRLERRIKNLQSTLTMLTQMGEDTTAIQEDIAVQVSAQMFIASQAVCSHHLPAGVVCSNKL